MFDLKADSLELAAEVWTDVDTIDVIINDTFWNPPLPAMIQCLCQAKTWYLLFMFYVKRHDEKTLCVDASLRNDNQYVCS